MTETLSFRRSVSGFTKSYMTKSHSEWWSPRQVTGAQTGGIFEFVEYFTSPGIASDNRLILRLEE